MRTNRPTRRPRISLGDNPGAGSVLRHPNPPARRERRLKQTGVVAVSCDNVALRLMSARDRARRACAGAHARAARWRLGKRYRVFGRRAYQLIELLFEDAWQWRMKAGFVLVVVLLAIRFAWEVRRLCR